jgi:glyoxylase-like metal-dependent hydrolase (beta-lactamase superfamily II)
MLQSDWRHPMPIKTIDRQHDLFGDERIVLVPLTGHTAGSIGARITLDRDGTFLLASDAVPLAAVLERELTPRNTLDAQAAMASLHEVQRMQAAGTQIIFGHDLQQWMTLRTGALAYR